MESPLLRGWNYYNYSNSFLSFLRADVSVYSETNWNNENNKPAKGNRLFFADGIIIIILIRFFSSLTCRRVSLF